MLLPAARKRSSQDHCRTRPYFYYPHETRLSFLQMRETPKAAARPQKAWRRPARVTHPNQSRKTSLR